MEDNALLIALLTNATAGKHLPEGLERLSVEQFERIYKTARRHDVAQLVFYALKQNGLLPEEENSVNALKHFYACLSRVARLTAETKNIDEALKNADIKHIMLKGTVIRNLYPSDWMRTSGDIDCLVPEEELDRAVSIFAGIGYGQENEKEYHDIPLAKQDIRVELHFNICENRPPLDKVLKRVWDYATPVDESTFAETPEFFMFHHLAHMAYHLTGGGCGVRNLLDTQMIRTHLEYDEAVVRDLCEEAGITRFYDLLIQLCDVWYANAPHTSETECLEQFMLSAGAFGISEFTQSATGLMTDVRRENLREYIFFPYEKLKELYPIVGKHKFLTPLYEVRRWINKLSQKGDRVLLKNVLLKQKTAEGTEMRHIMETTGLMHLIG